MVIKVADVLIPLAASLLPNLGFWGGTYLYRDYFYSWHIPPKSEVELAIRALLTAGADIPNLKEERDALQMKMQELRKNSDSINKEAQEQICRYAERIVRVSKELTEKENHLTNLEKYRETAEASGVGLVPKAFWMMTAANNIMGIASYLIWRSYDNFQSLAIYGSMLFLYWTYYPVLFTFGGKRLSFCHAILTDIAAGATICMFWSRSKIAGVLMIPFVGVLVYVSMDIYGVSQDGANVRLLAHRLNVSTPRISIRIV
uniref:Translocator protein n=1 Tax=Lygus hesperus TaxID=30085 RepID=A0A0A9Z2G1_LYGHE